MSRPVWRLRWKIAAGRRRLLTWNVLVPVLLLLPVALSAAAAPHRAAVVGVFIVFFGTFGNCIPLVRDRATGWNEKMHLTGYGSRPWLAERVAAETLIDLLELTPALTLVLLAVGNGTAASSIQWIVPSVILALLAAALLGSLVAALVTSIAEAALACGAVALFALHFGGIFRSAAPDTWAWTLERISPFRPLVVTLRGVLGDGRQLDSLAISWSGPLLATAGLAFLAMVLSPRLGRSRLEGG